MIPEWKDGIIVGIKCKNEIKYFISYKSLLYMWIHMIQTMYVKS